jgi:nitrite reductase/ring-hydroxylating ferredoxin subunit/uncharacterized membrane protein
MGMGVRDLVRPFERMEYLDPVGEWLSGAVTRVVGGGPLKGVLSGTWLGHPAHPALTDVPIGLFAGATLLDLLGGERAADATDAMTVLGLAAVAPTALTGLSDWADTVGPERRLGLVHALANVGGSSLLAAAVLSRRGGNRGAAHLFNLAGMGVIAVSGYLGGHLVFARGIGVDHTVFDEAPTDWTRVARDDEVAENTPVMVSAAGYGVLLYRHSGVIHAIAARCTHAGGPLQEGEVDDDLCVTCPWHGSRFRLADGTVTRGPATAPAPAFEVRVVEGNVEARLREG